MVLVWKPITDLPENWSTLSDGELGPLLQFWKDQRADLEQTGALATFTERLAREWSIETGQIEGVYDLDRGITQTLIEKGINADLIPSDPSQKPPELIAAIIQDHAEVLEGLFQFVKGDRPLSKSYIHELHAALMKHQDTTLVRDQFGQFVESKLLKGRYKERPNNPQRADGTIYEFCPPEQVEPEMERLLAMHAQHEKQRVPVEVEAGWMHHRFTQIHPYQDGNGRVARALASLLFVKAGWFPVVVTRDDRLRYIESLETADNRDLQSFVSLLADIQKRSLLKTIQTSTEIQPPKTVDGVVSVIKHVLSLKKPPKADIRSTAKQTADRLMNVAQERLERLAGTLYKELGTERPELNFRLDDFRRLSGLDPQLVPYVLNTRDYGHAQMLSISLEDRAMQRKVFRDQAYIVVHAHAIGSEFLGLIGFLVIFDDLTRSTITSKEPFQVNYAESYESAERRFRPWLEESLVNALTLWRKSL